VIAWLALHIADVVLEPWELPGWAHRAPLVIALIGFPIALALAAVVGYFLLRDAGWLGDSARPGSGVESSSLAVLPFATVGVYVEPHVTDG
jgi:hypothetical protein